MFLAKVLAWIAHIDAFREDTYYILNTIYGMSSTPHAGASGLVDPTTEGPLVQAEVTLSA
jgi:hypothetical protein